MSAFDDAFISLRYADNLVHGNGLVFNVGERVEGYTNFLWTMLLAGAIRIGLPGPQAAIIGCITCFVLELLIVVKVSRAWSIGGVPVAAIVLGANYIFATYGTSGMETMFCTLAATVALERATAGKLGQAGLAGIAGVLAHPDQMLLYGGLGAALALDPQTRRRLWLYGAPLVGIFVPYFLWRWHYYGDLFPNTYYAKSAGLTYFSQGLKYLVISGWAVGLFMLAPLAAYDAWRHRDALLTRYVVFSVPVYLAYVAKIGGDFMLGRLLVPVLPALLLMAERGASDLLARGHAIPAVAGLALLGVAAAPNRIVEEKQQLDYIADERTYYPVTSFDPLIIDSREFHRVQEINDRLVANGVRPTLAFCNIGIVGYFTKVPIVDACGLTDRTVAHQPLARRGRPGHEKMAKPAYLKARRVRLSDVRMYDPVYDRVDQLVGAGDRLYMARYDLELMRLLAPEGCKAVAMPDFIDHLIEQVSSGAYAPGREVRERDLAFFDEYYFASTSDPVRRAKLHALLGG